MPRYRRKKEETIKTADADSSDFTLNVVNCPKCSFHSIDTDEYHQHLKSHEEPKLVSATVISTKPKLHHCPQCKFTTVLRHKLKSHITNEHVNKLVETQGPQSSTEEQEVTSLTNVEARTKEKEETFLCFDCGFMAVNNDAFQDHRKWHEIDDPSASTNFTSVITATLDCDKCKFIAETPSDLLDHVALFHPPIPKLYCPNPDCNFETENAEDLIQHNKRHKHVDRSSNLCPTCGVIIEDVRKFTRHLRAHKAAKVMTCTQCDFTTFSRHQLTKHKKIHKRKCSLCFYTAKSSSSLWNHRNTKHRTEVSCTCTQCDQRFTTVELLQQHMKNNHGTSSKEYQCGVCNFYARSKAGLVQHKARHDKEETLYKCSECGWETRIKHRMLNHEKTHSGERPFQCDECGSAFSRKGTLKRHKLLVHSEEYIPFHCSHCPSTFKTKSDRNNHFKYVHAGIPKKGKPNNEKKHECAFCEYKTDRRPNLEKHMRTHTGDKPYECTHCGHKFSDQSNLKAHIKSHKLMN